LLSSRRKDFRATVDRKRVVIWPGRSGMFGFIKVHAEQRSM
jgi:hypothetical protein